MSSVSFLIFIKEESFKRIKPRRIALMPQLRSVPDAEFHANEMVRKAKAVGAEGKTRKVELRGLDFYVTATVRKGGNPDSLIDWVVEQLVKIMDKDLVFDNMSTVPGELMSNYPIRVIKPIDFVVKSEGVPVDW